MEHKLPELAFEKNALASSISEETIEYHYGKHHSTYVANLNKLIVGTEFETMSLEEICARATGPVFNHAAQHYNHSFYWKCLMPGKAKPSGSLAAAISRDFGSFDEFKEKFIASAAGNFGSGWTWLVKSGEKLVIVNTGNAAMPPLEDNRHLLVCDVWEHAYYIDYRNNRKAHLEALMNIINWDFVAKQFV